LHIDVYIYFLKNNSVALKMF